jgi:hypothetical protein
MKTTHTRLNLSVVTTFTAVLTLLSFTGGVLATNLPPGQELVKLFRLQINH